MYYTLNQSSADFHGDIRRFIALSNRYNTMMRCYDKILAQFIEPIGLYDAGHIVYSLLIENELVPNARIQIVKMGLMMMNVSI